MKHKNLLKVCSFLACCSLLSACGEQRKTTPPSSLPTKTSDSSLTISSSEEKEETEIEKIYHAYQANGGTLDYEDWLSSIKGEPGKDGTSLRTGKGVPASTLGQNGDSYIDLDTWNYYTKANGVWTLVSTLGEKKDDRPEYVTAWPTTDYTLSLKLAQGGTGKVKINNKGGDLGGNRFWYFLDQAYDVRFDQSGNYYYINFNDAYNYSMTWSGVKDYCMATRDKSYVQSFYNFQEGAEEASITYVGNDANSVKYYTSKALNGGYDGLFWRFAVATFGSSEMEELYKTYPNAGVLFGVKNGVFTSGTLVTDITQVTGQYSYWLTFSFTNIGSTDLGFTPKILVHDPTSSSSSSSDSTSSASTNSGN